MAYIIAIFETMIFLKSGVHRFDTSKRAAWLSMAVPVALLPLAFVTVPIAPPLGTDDLPPIDVANVSILIKIVSYALFAGGMFAYAQVSKQLDRFPHMITSMNWVGLGTALLSVPVLWLHYIDFIDRQTVEDLFIWVLVYQYALVGFIIWCCYRIPWELAAALAIFSIFINQSTHDVLYIAFEFPIVDYFDVY